MPTPAGLLRTNPFLLGDAVPSPSVLVITDEDSDQFRIEPSLPHEDPIFVATVGTSHHAGTYLTADDARTVIDYLTACIEARAPKETQK